MEDHVKSLPNRPVATDLITDRTPTALAHTHLAKHDSSAGHQRSTPSIAIAHWYPTRVNPSLVASAADA